MTAEKRCAPLIGVTTSELHLPEQVKRLAKAEPPMRELALGLAYPAAIAGAGGLPVVLPPIEVDVEAVVERLDGLLMSGGPDVHPSAYGAAPHPALGPTDAELDRVELAIARRADDLGLPVLALCRGAQVVNVARGGTLVQDIPDLVGGDVVHRQARPGLEPSHAVRISGSSRLHGVMELAEAPVNSFHHQAIAALGRGLTAVAWAPDGVIEAIEATDRDFLVGVQWHAESLTERPEQARLFSAFIAAASRHAAGIRRAAA
jgi:putative glutamine amidotransferase